MEQSILNRADNSADVDLSILKVVSFIIVSVLVAGASGYFIAKLDLVYGMLSLLLFWVLFILQIFFIKGWTRIIIATFSQSAAMTIPSAIIFKDNFSGYVFLAFGVFFAMLILAEHYGRNELANSLKIPFWRTAKNIANRVMPATFIFLVIVYFFIAGKSIVATKGQFVMDSIIAPLIQKTIMPDFSSKTSLEDLIKKFADKSLPSSVKDEYVSRMNKTITDYAGSIDSRAPLGSVIYEFFSDRLTSSSLAVKASVGFGLVTLLWFLVKTISLILYIPVATIAGLFYEILIVLNFAIVQYESRSREIILLK